MLARLSLSWIAFLRLPIRPSLMKSLESIWEEADNTWLNALRIALGGEQSGNAKRWVHFGRKILLNPFAQTYTLDRN